jgi:polyisoprenoid-binding protein YceI
MKDATTNKAIWVLDPTHSEITFKVKHLMISNVKGEFTKFEATIDGEDFAKAEFSGRIDASSISTNNADRDTHLKSTDFFDVDNHKEIVFNSTSFHKVDDDKYKLLGQLTLKGIRNSVSLDVEFGGIAKDPYGNEKAGFSASGRINRKDWELNWNTALETGGVLVSEEVRIFAELQFVKQ